MSNLPGKVIWLCGAPGMGKSTSAQILGRDKGYVYYEADTFGLMKNPFIDLNADNPSMAQMKQKKLKGFLALISKLYIYNSSFIFICSI